MSKEFAMLLKVRADASQVGSEFKRVEAAANGLKSLSQGLSSALTGNFSGLTTAVGGMGSSLLNIHPAGVAATAAVSALGAAAGGIGTALFAAAKSASDFGSEIYNARVQTGLGAESLSALKFEAAQSDVEFSKVAQSITKFSILVADAARGNKEASATLARLGINAKDAMSDIDGAAAKAFKSISELPAGIEKTDLAAKTFSSKSGKEMLKLIDQMGGDLPGVTEKYRQMGMTMDNSAVAAADRFGDRLTLLGGRLEMIKVKIGSAVMPAFDRFFTSMETWLDNNQAEIDQWGKTLNVVLNDAMDLIAEAAQWAKDHPIVVEVVKRYGFGFIGAYLNNASDRAAEEQSAPDLGSSPPRNQPTTSTNTSTPTGGGGRSRSGGGGGGGANNARQTRNRQIAAAISANQADLTATTNDLDNSLSNLIDTDLIEAKVASAKASVEELFANIRAQIEQQRELALAEAKTADERLAITMEFDNKVTELNRNREKTLQDIKLKGNARLKEIDANARAESLAEAKRDFEIEQDLLDKRYENNEMTFSEYIERSANLRARLRKVETDQLDAIVKDEKSTAQDIATAKKRLAEIAHESAMDMIADQDRLIAKGKEQREQLIQTLLQTRAIMDRMAVSQAELQVEAARARYDRNPTKKNYEAIKQAELDLARVKHEIALQELADQEALAIAAAGTNEVQIAAIRAQFEVLREELNTQWGIALKRINDIKPQEGPWRTWANTIKQSTSSAGAAIGSLGSTLFESFKNILGALESSIANWILYGDSVKEAMRKAVAAELAGIAAKAAIQALYATGLGLFYLATLQFGQAANAFAAAGVFAAVAAAAGFGARAIAGDSFKRQTGQSGGATSGNRSTSGQGTAYSGQENATVNGSRTNGGVLRPEIVIKDKSGMFSQLFETEIRNNSRVRGLIIETANS